MGMRGRTNYKLANGCQNLGQLRGEAVNQSACAIFSSSTWGVGCRNQEDGLRQVKQGCKVGEEVEGSLFQAKQPWAELG